MSAPPLRFEILSLSASASSVSRACTPALRAAFERGGHAAHVTDIRDLPPVWSSSIKVPNLPQPYTDLFSRVQRAEGVIFCLPIYCYTASGAAKTVSEIIGGTGGALTRKPVAFVVASGTVRSHLAVRDLMASMAFEQYTYCYPRHVSAQAEHLDDRGRPGPELTTRIEELATEFARFSGALREAASAELAEASA